MLLVLLWTVASGAQAKDELLQSLFQQLGQRQGYQADYVEKKYLAITNVPLLQSGSLSFAPPDTMVRRQTAPNPQRFMVKGNQLTIESASGVKQVSIDRIPELQAFLVSIQAVLSGDIAKLKSYYGVTLSGEIARWQLQLTPQEERLASYIKSIHFDGRYDEVVRIRIDEIDGDWSDMELTPVKSDHAN